MPSSNEDIKPQFGNTHLEDRQIDTMTDYSTLELYSWECLSESLLNSSSNSPLLLDELVAKIFDIHSLCKNSGVLETSKNKNSI